MIIYSLGRLFYSWLKRRAFWRWLKKSALHDAEGSRRLWFVRGVLEVFSPTGAYEFGWQRAAQRYKIEALSQVADQATRSCKQSSGTG